MKGLDVETLKKEHANKIWFGWFDVVFRACGALVMWWVSIYMHEYFKIDVQVGYIGTIVCIGWTVYGLDTIYTKSFEEYQLSKLQKAAKKELDRKETERLRAELKAE